MCKPVCQGKLHFPYFHQDFHHTTQFEVPVIELARLAYGTLAVWVQIIRDLFALECGHNIGVEAMHFPLPRPTHDRVMQNFYF
jgi:hypothetical protein